MTNKNTARSLFILTFETCLLFLNPIYYQNWNKDLSFRLKILACWSAQTLDTMLRKDTWGKYDDNIMILVTRGTNVKI